MNPNYQRDLRLDNASNPCYWCTSEVAASALRCPHCRMWRIDIYKGRVLTYTFLIIWLMHSFTGLYFNWWGDLQDLWGFTLSVLISVNGWLNLILLAAFWIYYIKTSRKIGMFWWV
ncbi:MAG: hypothetical protein ACE5D0_06905 [Fidelibacterota bacterium]